ncbi:PKD domain-containing protein [Palaeococcus sp. (in: euryarchaeotes)]|uniref:PKD domain-containing protein n=1 Tax=Palaeococcus sp. (in: euryarchaeotes) TaxID=2820298 RepID=UPI0026001582|nr:PKD domain-containing protein [Palaeococcus sp. (in: euryarchaeotes)]
MHNLTDKRDASVVWIEKIENVATYSASMVAGKVAGVGVGATGVLAPLAPVASAGGSYVASKTVRYIFDNLKSHIINNPEKNAIVPADNTAVGYAYVKGVLRRWWANRSAAIATSFLVTLSDEPTGRYSNHIITIKAVLGYDVAKKGRLGWSWENKVVTIETYVTIHIVADDTGGRGETTSSSGYALKYTRTLQGTKFESNLYIDGKNQGGTTKESTKSSKVEGMIGTEEYYHYPGPADPDSYPQYYKIVNGVDYYYQGLLTGGDYEDYYSFHINIPSFSDSSINSYKLAVELIAGRGSPMRMDVEYRGISYTGYSTKDSGDAQFEIWVPKQASGYWMNIRIYPDEVQEIDSGTTRYVLAEGAYMINVVIKGYYTSNYQPYVHIKSTSTVGTHLTLSFHAEDKKASGIDDGQIYEYKVYWGDGRTTTVSNVQRSTLDKSIDHIYSYGGTYKVRIIVYDDSNIGNNRDVEGIKVTVGNSGGGGGCPFLYTYSSDGWKEENNVLVWAENATRPFLNTVDSYLFEANEINGSVILGIGEPGEDVDFVDAIKLYRVYAPPGYDVAESYGGMIYAYRDVESGIAKDNHGRDVTSLISGEDDNYWVGDKGEYIDITLNLSSENLLVIRGIDNPQEQGKLGRTVSTIWIYANVSGEWAKLGEIKVRHSMHTNVINLDALSWFFGDKVELRFEMRDRNGIDFIGVAHDYRLASVEGVPLIEASYGYENISKRDGNYLRINPGDFVRLNFEGKGDGLYLLKVYGFYFNRAMIGRGIGIVRANETNVAEAKLQESIEAGKYYVLLPLLEDYSGICHIEWYVDGMYVPGSKPVVSFEAGEHEIELYIYRYDGSVQYYSLHVS